MPISLALLFLMAQAAVPGAPQTMGQTSGQTAPETPVMPEPIVAPLRDASVTLECGLQADGGLTNCRVVSETPAGHGLGDRALRDARRTRYSRPTVPPRPGETVRFTTRYPWPAGVPDQP
ncbi:energy transducer TonB [Brevundimonas goettingensis]|uniref:TonB C-terminal domain-containing protein n=1 Tax=Brevundimonas goettingensis TaxID=2774190 RepID=A0A975C218_9CAUL|nr:hypothetical protein [Brevundimonas goettingensis]QTC92416.1 hypothetical protein IFJ75_05910 [Brevundimonas goettingensis]